jgi:hypothetical protein
LEIVTSNPHIGTSNTIESMKGIFLFFLLPPLVAAHSRWACPKPRNVNTEITVGPCGSETNDFSTSDDELIKVSPGPMLVQWEEAVSHDGSPFRISLSQDGTDTALPVCILLDHIPHHDGLNPNIEDESTYTLYSMVITIPNVACTRCSLHIANIKTSDEGNLGSPTGRGCTDPNGTCKTVYHSCTIPFTITGTTPRSDFQCTNQNPSDWPKQWIGDNDGTVNAGTIGVYRRESGLWDGNSFLMNIPDKYRTIDSSVASCDGGDVATTESPTPSPSDTDEIPTSEPNELGLFPRLLSQLWQLFLQLFGLR